MATVNGLTAERMLEIEAASIVDGHIDGSGHLILTAHDGTEIDAGDASVGIMDASTTQSGKVELATSAETSALIDTVRVVTPGGLSALVATLHAADTALTATDTSLDGRLDILEAIPGNKVQSITAPAENAAYSVYPSGISVMSIGSGSGWLVNGGLGTIVTVNQGQDRTAQTCYSNAGGTNFPTSWVRTYHSNDGGGGWTVWAMVLNDKRLIPSHFNEGTSFTSYPYGPSYIYMSATETMSGGWGFAGKFGLVTTYRFSNDLAIQTWQKHQGGSGGQTELWQRTANGPTGWCPWKVVASDTGPFSVEDQTTASGITSITGQPGSTQVNIPFVAPPSGKAWVTISGNIGQSQNSFIMYLGFDIREGSTPGSGTLFTAEDTRRAIATSKPVTSGASAYTACSRRVLIKGLTPRQAYIVRALYWVSSALASGSYDARGLAVELVL